VTKHNRAEAGHLKADLLLVLVTLLAAAGWVFSLQSLKGLPPLLFMGVRFLAAGLLLLGFGLGRARRLGARDLTTATAIGVVMAVTMLCWILGLHWVVNVGVGAFISSLGMIMAPLVGWLLFGMRVTPQTWTGAAIAVAGMAFLSLEHGLHMHVSDLLFFAAACGLALHFNLNTRFVAQLPVVPLTAIQLTVVGVFCLLASAGFERWPATVDVGVLGWLMASILIATSLRFFLQLKGQSMAPVGHAALIMTLEPVWTSIIAAAWRGERMSHFQLIGCVLIFVALFFSRWRRTPRPAEAAA
jgi:drug/metabolite transporter (DMT)-like permease